MHIHDESENVNTHLSRWSSASFSIPGKYFKYLHHHHHHHYTARYIISVWGVMYEFRADPEAERALQRRLPRPQQSTPSQAPIVGTLCLSFRLSDDSQQNRPKTQAQCWAQCPHTFVIFSWSRRSQYRASHRGLWSLFSVLFSSK